MRCPVCQKEAVEKFRPFCCAHCANVDLNGWFTEKYTLPAEISEDDEWSDELSRDIEAPQQ